MNNQTPKAIEIKRNSETLFLRNKAWYINFIVSVIQLQQTLFKHSEILVAYTKQKKPMNKETIPNLSSK